jgi:hypothetical protein
VKRIAPAVIASLRPLLGAGAAAAANPDFGPGNGVERSRRQVPPAAPDSGRAWLQVGRRWRFHVGVPGASSSGRGTGRPLVPTLVGPRTSHWVNWGASGCRGRRHPTRTLTDETCRRYLPVKDCVQP